MEIIFHNKTPRDKKAHRAYASCELMKNNKIRFWVMCVIALAFAAFSLIYSILYPWDKLLDVFITFTVAALLFALMPYVLGRINGWKFHRGYIRTNGTDCDEMEFFFEEERFIRRVIKTQEEAAFGYEVIGQVIDDKQYYFIICSTRLLVLDKKNFLQGDETKFLSFLRQKAPEARFVKNR